MRRRFRRGPPARVTHLDSTLHYKENLDMRLNDLKIDAVKFEQGDWVGDIPDMGGLRLKVRGIGNSDYRRMQSRLFEAEPRQYKVGGKLPPERQDNITAKCLLNTVLMDWEGLLDENGAPIPYSKELASDLLTKPEYKRFRDAVAWAASVVAEGIEFDQDEAGKFSEMPSDGGSNGATS